ncbi:MAG: hypothetical protein ACOH1C_08870, partial [Rothia mucilaginosa]|uniref:hypothetical protein n=1 Tax=Rothia mucilaginosa TaxID=43675 RepID=UPI003B59527E
HQCAKSIINLMRLTVTLCMIVDARVLPSGTTLYSTSATDKSPVRTRHTPTNRTTETIRQAQRCALTLTRAKVGAPP